jgi:hypothetical protein
MVTVVCVILVIASFRDSIEWSYNLEKSGTREKVC